VGDWGDQEGPNCPFRDVTLEWPQGGGAHSWEQGRINEFAPTLCTGSKSVRKIKIPCKRGAKGGVRLINK